MRFPITGGRIDAAHGGRDDPSRRRAALLGRRRSLTLRAPRVAVGRKIMLSARVGGSRVHLLELTGARVSRSGFNTNVSGLRARLTQKAATALNATFGVKAFKKGLRLGTASVRSQHRRGGHPGAQRHLARARSGRAAGADEPGHRARRDRAGDADRHDRGLPDLGRPGQARPLRRARSATRAASRSPRARPSCGWSRSTSGSAPSPQLFAAINGGAQKAAILDLDLTGVTPAVDGRTVTLAGVTAKLTQGAADALNAAFATTAFSAGLVLGRATVVAEGA